MTFRVARELSRTFAAVAPVAGADWMLKPKPARPVPLLYITGTADPMNPVDGGPVRIGRKSYGRKPPTRQLIARWVELHDCSEPPRVVYDKDDGRGVAYCNEDGSEAVVLYTLAGHGHHWPGGKSLLPAAMAGPNQATLNATDVIWTFFAQHALPQVALQRDGSTDADGPRP